MCARLSVVLFFFPLFLVCVSVSNEVVWTKVRVSVVAVKAKGTVSIGGGNID